jgi:(S)-2-hydroxyglutarate dehydrogenase
VGAGIVGLAVARELSRRHPGASICVLEREREPGTHQTRQNSGVIHAGIYYPPGSLKAALCVQGARRLYEYCERKGIAHERCGKVILATRAGELAGLDELERRGRANGVKGLRRLNLAQVKELEPHAQAIEGLHSPNSGIVDFGAVAGAYAQDLQEAGGTLHTGCELLGTSVIGGALRLLHTRGATDAKGAIFCAGACSDRLAVSCGAPQEPRIVPFRGAYLRLRPGRAGLVRALIYPLPDPSLPFLGVHFTKTVEGEVLLGPTALLALDRASALHTLSWPGAWRMFARYRRTGVQELRHALSRHALVEAAARFLPELTAADVEPAFEGVRAQALSREGTLVDDFVFSYTERALHVRNAPSPAATSSLAIAAYVADAAERALRMRKGG